MSYAINNVMKNTRVKLIAFSVILVFSMLTSVSAWAATAGATVSKAEVEPKPKTYPDSQDVVLNFAGAEKILYTINGKSVKISADGTAGDENTLSSDGSQLKITVTTTTTIKAVGVAMTTNAAGKEVVAKSSAFSGSYKIVLPAPTFGVKGGSYKAGQSVSLNVPQVDGTNVVAGDVAFFYTTDPKAAVESFTAYEGPIAVAQNTTIRAYMAKGELKSKVVSAKYTINLPSPKIEQKSKTFTATAETNILEPDGYDGGAIYYTTNGSNPTATETEDCKKYVGAIPIQSALMTLKAVYVKDGAISKPVSATYKINLAAPTFNQKAGTMTDNSKAIVIDAKVGDIYYTTDKTVSTAIPALTNGVPAAPWTPYVQSLTLTENQTTIRAIAVSNGVASKVASVGYTINLPIPVFTPKAGKIPDATTVTIAKATSLSSDAKIYYTTTAVTTSTVTLADVQRAPWSEYPTIGISIDSATTTIKAVVVKNNIVSKIASATYTMNLPTVKSSVSPKAYTTPQSVKLSAAAGATIRYTLDGSIPTKDNTNASTKDFTPETPAIQINSSTVVKAIAVKNNVASATATFAYTINLPAITFNPAGGFVAPGSKISITNTSFPKGAVIYYNYTPGVSVDGTTSPIDADFKLQGTPSIYDSTVGIVPTGEAGDPVVVKAVALLDGATYSKVTTGTFKIENAQALTIDTETRTISAPVAAPFTSAPTAFTAGGTPMDLNNHYTYDASTKKITLTTAGFLAITTKATGDVTLDVTAGGRKYTGKIVLEDALITGIYNPGKNAVTSITVTGPTTGSIVAGSKFWVVDTSTPKKAVLGTSAVTISANAITRTAVTIPSTLFSGNVSAYNVVANKIYKSPTVAVGDFEALTIDMTTRTMTKSGVTTTEPTSVIVGGTTFASSDYDWSGATITFTKAGILKIAAMTSGTKAVSVVCNGVTVIGNIIVSDAPTGITLQNPGTAGGTTAVVATGNTIASDKYIIMNGTGMVTGTTGDEDGDPDPVDNIVIDSTNFVAGELSAYRVTASTLYKPLKVTVAANPYASVVNASTTVGLQAPVTGVSTASTTITWAEGAGSFKPLLTMSVGINGTDKWVLTKTAESDTAKIIKEITADGVITMDPTKAVAGATNATVTATLKDSTGTKVRLNKDNAEITKTITIAVAAKQPSKLTTGGTITSSVGDATIVADGGSFTAGAIATTDGSTIAKSIPLKAELHVTTFNTPVYNAAISITRAADSTAATVEYVVGNQPTSDADYDGAIDTANAAVVTGKIAGDLNDGSVIYLLVQNVTGKTYYKITVTVLVDVTFTSAQADGGTRATTSKVTMTFDKDIPNLTTADFTITDATGGAATGATKGTTLTRTARGVYDLAITGVTQAGDITVGVAKAGCNFDRVSIAEVGVLYVTPVTIISAVATNGGARATTTEIAVTMSSDISTLAAADFTITASATNGPTATVSSVAQAGAVYTLSITGVAKSGNVDIAFAKDAFSLASKKGIAVSYATPKTFSTVTPNGSVSSTTTSLALVFTADVNLLAATDFTIVDTDQTGAKVGALSKTGTGEYTLTVTDVKKSGDIELTVGKDTFVFTNPTKTVAILYAEPIGFTSAVAKDGVAGTETTTQVRVVFNKAVNSLLATDFTITDVDGTDGITGTAGKPTAIATTGTPGEYLLTLKTVTKEAKIKIAVAKNGFAFAPAFKDDVDVYFDAT